MSFAYPIRFFAGLATFAMVASIGLVAGSTPALAFGSTESLGQNSEHQHITEWIGKADPLWESKSLSLLAGTAWNFGAVAAPDRPTDSSATPLVGLSPGYKHCDDGDWLDTPGYPHPKTAAVGALEACARYYQHLLNRAVRAAGQLVSKDLVVNESVFAMTSGKGRFIPDDHCAWRFSLTADSNPKCDVINALGRSLHLAQDVYAHTNWADLADPNKPISRTNPPGLGSTDVPEFLRFPASPNIPDGLISGCDDSVPWILPGYMDCKNRITHSVLAKDNGTFKEDGSEAKPTSKYKRGSVTVDGVNNFQRAVTGAMRQSASTWSDLKDAIIARYGDERGNAIVAVIRSDSVEGAGLEAVEFTDEPFVLSDQWVDDSEFAVDPAQDAPLGSGDKATDPGHSGDIGEPEDREASGVVAVDDFSTAIPAPSDNTPILLLGLAVAMAVVAAVWFGITRWRSSGASAR